MTRVLVLRPEPGASATVSRARARGLDARAMPLFEVEPVEWQVPDAGSFDGLLLTSANALRHGGEGLCVLRGLPVYAVGPATAEAARDAGFDVASTGHSGVERLLGSVEPDLRLLHLAGEDRKMPAEAPQQIQAVTVYRARPRVADPGALRNCVAMIHSPRAGERLASLVAQDGRSSIAISAISAAAADSVGKGWARVESSAEPNEEALLALTERLCNKPVES